MDVSDVTVAVLTQAERLHLLENLISSLEQVAKRHDVQLSVLIVGHHVDATVSALDRKYPALNIRAVTSDGWVPSGRQRAVEECATSWLLFLDDDVTVSANLLEAYRDRYLDRDRDGDVGALYGQVSFVGDATRVFRATWYTGLVHAFQVAEVHECVEWAPTANAMFSMRALTSIGGFNLSNPTGLTGEDADIGIRLSSAGYVCLTVPEAEVFHTTETWASLVTNIKRTYISGRAEAWLVSQHPSRRTLDVSRIQLVTTTGAGVFAATIMSAGGVAAMAGVGLVWLVTWFWRQQTSPNDDPLVVFLSGAYGLAAHVGYLQGTLEDGRITDIIHRFEWYRQPGVFQKRIVARGPF